MAAGELHCAVGAMPAADALAGFTGTVLVATPTAFTVAVATDGLLRIPGHDPWPLPPDCFQLTGFDGHRELRWLADDPRAGRVVWLAEDPTHLPDLPIGDPMPYADTLAQRAVLWGEPAPGEGDGFSAWSAGRIGTAHYPCPPGATRRERAVLTSVEYIDHDENGNAGVVERRLLEIRRMDLTRGNDR
ncbi:MAG: CRISPR-associated protein Csx19 [Pseudonocardia sp.]|nr:CRISPR-associated protein Csx19 [Pseudonocardia sp.]